jgi:hypothetical protein
LLAAALGCLLVVAVPGGVGAASRPHRGGSEPNGFSHAEARRALDHARNLMQHGPSAKTAPTPSTTPAGSDLTMALRDLYLARPALTGAERRSADRLLSRSNAAGTAQAQAAVAVKSICKGHFCVHYVSPTPKAWAETTWQTLEHVWAVEVPMMKREPLSDHGSADPDVENPDDRLDVYLQDLGAQGYYGYCTPDNGAAGRQVAAYCSLDDDFARSQYGAAPMNSLRVTAAHEFFHTLQFAADVTEATWFMEGSATWAEDVVYNDINDNYQYLTSSPIRHPRTPLDYSGGLFPYGSFIFFKFASQRGGNAMVRRFWDGAVGPPKAITAIRSAVGTSHWPSYFTQFASWNTLPGHSYRERASYPSPTWWYRKSLKTAHASTGVKAVRIPRLASAAVQLVPGPHLSRKKRLVVNIDAPATWSGSRALFQRRYRDGRVTQTVIALHADGNRRLVVSFDHAVLKSVAVVLANSSSVGPTRLFRVKAAVR